MDFRTEDTNGVLLTYLPTGPLSSDFIDIKIADGKASISYGIFRGQFSHTACVVFVIKYIHFVQSELELTVLRLPFNVTDGDWHSLSWAYNMSHLMLSVDDNGTEAVALANLFGDPLPSQLDSQAELYVGGLPGDPLVPQGLYRHIHTYYIQVWIVKILVMVPLVTSSLRFAIVAPLTSLYLCVTKSG